MTQEERIEGNKLIANFIHRVFPLIREKDIFRWYDPPEVVKIGRSIIWTEHPILEYTSAKAHFHEDWNWLMPVIEKIEKTGCIVEIWLCLGKGCRITKGNFKTPIQTISNTESNSTIGAVWLAVVEFIKWYNQQNNG